MNHKPKDNGKTNRKITSTATKTLRKEENAVESETEKGLNKEGGKTNQTPRGESELIHNNRIQDSPNSDSVENPFIALMKKREKSGSRIFINKNRKLLNSEYIPEVLPHRKKEIDKIVSILSAALQGGHPSNIFIYGTSGTGKTAVIKIVQRHLKEIRPLMKQQGLRPMKMVYVNCRHYSSTYGLIAQIGNELAGELSGEIPTGWPMERVYGQLLTNMDRNGSTMILVLDELNALLEKKNGDVLYLLSRMNTDLTNSSVQLMTVTNNPKIWNELDPSIRSSLTPEDLFFKSYNANQLKDILEERSKLCFVECALEEGVISFCSALAAQDHGDARIALELLKKAGELAERNEAEKVERKHVEDAQSVIETSKVKSVIKSLSLHAKAVTLSIYQYSNNGIEKVNTGQTYDRYMRNCGEMGNSPLTQRRISGIISDLDSDGIVQSLVISKGRHGRTREINLAASRKDVQEALSQEDGFKELVDMKVEQQTI